MTAKTSSEGTDCVRGMKRPSRETTNINEVERVNSNCVERPPKRIRTTDGNEPKGAYKQYYNRRSGDSCTGEDDRLPLVRTILEKISRPHILDIGCNDGSLTIAIAKIGPCQIVGIDIDAKLVNRARNTVRDFVLSSRREPSIAGMGCDTTKAQTDEDNVFPYNATFRCEDVCDEGARTVAEKGKYDVVICLSVTKWIHITHGDEGIKRFFTTIRNCLNENGCMVLEPQLSKSYKKARKRGQAPKEMTLDKIKLRPEKFKDYLLAEGGFHHMEMLRDVRGKGQAFNRPVMAFFKVPKSFPPRKDSNDMSSPNGRPKKESISETAASQNDRLITVLAANGHKDH